ncbi:Ovarian cancer-associated protein 2 [Kappamyces sp. JEL0680]|nr:Ovarian cancer-associated protein 2 [Kappamyces sp. JEL0680]
MERILSNLQLELGDFEFVVHQGLFPASYFGNEPNPSMDLTGKRAHWNFQDTNFVYPVGIEATLAALDELWTNDFVGIIGFSQGAAAALIWASRCTPAPKWIVMCSGFNLLYFSKGFGQPATYRGPSLHVYSDADEVIPAALSKRTVEEVGGDTIEHSMGHFVPRDRETTLKIAGWIRSKTAPSRL